MVSIDLRKTFDLVDSWLLLVGKLFHYDFDTSALDFIGRKLFTQKKTNEYMQGKQF